MKKNYFTTIFLCLTTLISAQSYEYSLSFEGINSSTGNYQIALIATPDFEQTSPASTSDIGAVLNLPSGLTIGNFAFGNAGIREFEWSAIQEVSYDGGVTDLIQLYRQEFIPNTITHSANQPLTLIKFDIINESGTGNPTSGELAFANDFMDGGTGNTYESFMNVDLTGGSTQDYFSNFDPTASSINFSTLSNNNFGFEDTIVSIYPNPTNGIINIQSNNTISYSIYNMLGQSVKLNGLLESNISKTVSLSHLPDGIYILKAQDNNKNSKSFKIIKKN